MEVSMVIAAWGEGVGLLVSPSPSPDRSSPAKTRVNRWLGHRTRPHLPRALSLPPHAKSVKNGQKH
jgi:hypothetical protein